MSYSTCEVGLLAVIRKHADFPAANTSRGDFRIIGHGKERVAVLTFAGGTEREETVRSLIHTWTTNINLFVPWRGEYSTWLTTMQTEMQKIVDTIIQWPKLNATDGVLRVSLSVQSPDMPTLEYGAYRGQKLICTIEELRTPSRQE